MQDSDQCSQDAAPLVQFGQSDQHFPDEVTGAEVSLGSIFGQQFELAPTVCAEFCNRVPSVSVQQPVTLTDNSIGQQASATVQLGRRERGSPSHCRSTGPTRAESLADGPFGQ